MRELKDQAIVLRMGYFREADIWLKLLLENHGVHTVFAFGAVKSRRRFCGCLDVLNSLDCHIRVSRTGEYCNLEEANLLAGPRNLRRNWKNMGIAANCMRFVEAFPIGPENSGDCFELVEELRDILEAGQTQTTLMPLFFRLRLATTMGFAPSLGACGICHEPARGELLFLANEGHLVCSRCAEGFGFAQKRFAIRLSEPARAMLERARHNFPSGREEDGLTAYDRRQCACAIDAFIAYHLGLVWNKSAFQHI